MRKQRGITLVALIITVIIMLILVAVSVNVIVKSNLIGTAEKAADGYKTAKEQEEALGSNPITINGKEYSSLDEYLAIIEGKSVDNVKWIYVENEDGNLEITGIDLRERKSEGKTSVIGTGVSGGNYDTITLNLENDTLVIPDKIDGKNVVSVSLQENLFDGMLSLGESFLTISGVKNIVFADNIQKLGIQRIFFKDVETIKLPHSLKTLRCNNVPTWNCNKCITIYLYDELEDIEQACFVYNYAGTNADDMDKSVEFILNFPDGKNENLVIPENKWGATTIIIEGFAEE